MSNKQNTDFKIVACPVCFGSGTIRTSARKSHRCYSCSGRGTVSVTARSPNVVENKKTVEENTHVQDLYAENKKLANLLKFILDIDAMTTMEFCNAYRKDHPTYKGSVDLAIMEMFAVDSNKWHLVKDRAKEVRKWLTEFETKLKQ